MNKQVFAYYTHLLNTVAFRKTRLAPQHLLYRLLNLGYKLANRKLLSNSKLSSCFHHAITGSTIYKYVNIQRTYIQKFLYYILRGHMGIRS